MKTIRQIADEIGVSKQTVYKRFKGKLYTVCAPYAHTEHGTLYIEEQGEKLIKQDFFKDKCSTGAHTSYSTGAAVEQLENEKIVVALQAAIDTLQMQLEVKDRQIEELTETLKAAQQTAAAAQALHAGTMKQRILCDDKVEQQIHEPAQKKSWISKILGNSK